MNLSPFWYLAVVTTTTITISPTYAYNVVQQKNDIKIAKSSARNANSRRNLFESIIAATAAAVTLPVAHASAAEVATTDGEQQLEDVYFGMGCFWHIQHEFIQAERDLLNRNDQQLTSRTGYAGGKSSDKEGRVCYHNFQNLADYGKLGHGEVVGMTIPSSKLQDFAKVYFSLFNPKTGERVDPQDRGGEYRYLIGLPNGVNHPQYDIISNIAKTTNNKDLVLGKGNEGDTLGKNIVYVYDTKKFPFYQAEVYHQYHDDFQSPPYGPKYNNLGNIALDDERLKITGCPDRV